jgi:hypothetical protein
MDLIQLPVSAFDEFETDRCLELRMLAVKNSTKRRAEPSFGAKRSGTDGPALICLTIAPPLTF